MNHAEVIPHIFKRSKRRAEILDRKYIFSIDYKQQKSWKALKHSPNGGGGLNIKLLEERRHYGNGKIKHHQIPFAKGKDSQKASTGRFSQILQPHPNQDASQGSKGSSRA
jgi:hypothetical protein